MAEQQSFPEGAGPPEVKRRNLGSRITTTILLWFVVEPPFRIFLIGNVPTAVNLTLSALTLAAIWFVLRAADFPSRAFTRLEWLAYTVILLVTLYVVGG